MEGAFLTRQWCQLIAVFASGAGAATADPAGVFVAALKIHRVFVLSAFIGAAAIITAPVIAAAFVWCVTHNLFAWLQVILSRTNMIVRWRRRVKCEHQLFGNGAC